MNTENQENQNQPLNVIGQDDLQHKIVDDGGIKVITGTEDMSVDEFTKVRDEIVNKTDAPPAQVSNYKAMPAWDVMKEEFEAAGLEFKMPEALTTGKHNDKPLTPKEEFQLMREMIIDNTNFGFEEDPLINMYLSSKEKNPELNPDEFITHYQTSMSIHNMKPKEFLTAYVKSLDATLDDEAVEQKLSGFSEQELKTESEKYKQKVLEDFYKKNQEQREVLNQKYSKELEIQDKQQKTIMDTVINGVKSKKGFDNIQIDDKTLDEISETYNSTFTRNESNPLVNVNIPQKFVELLTQENIYKIIGYLTKGDILKNKADERVRELEEKLGIKPLDNGQVQLGQGFRKPI